MIRELRNVKFMVICLESSSLDVIVDALSISEDDDVVLILLLCSVSLSSAVVTISLAVLNLLPVLTSVYDVIVSSIVVVSPLNVDKPVPVRLLDVTDDTICVNLVHVAGILDV